MDDDHFPYLEKELVCEEDAFVHTPKDMANLLNEKFRLSKRTEEYLYLLCYDNKNRLLGVYEISHGSLSSSYAGPREIYQKALLCGAAWIAVAHNHPSGDCTPGETDMATQKRLKEAGKLLGIFLRDFLVLGGKNYYSAAEHGLC